MLSHTLRGCVDWNPMVLQRTIPTPCHTLRGCVDWNHHTMWTICGWTRHTLRGCVDWNSSPLFWIAATIGHTLRGCVDWNVLRGGNISFCGVTPFVGVWIETQETWCNLQVAVCHTLRGCVDWNNSLFGGDGNAKKSHPSWVCGLKQNICSQAGSTYWSHPSWVCGLKPFMYYLGINAAHVTPFVGVWIETLY